MKRKDRFTTKNDFFYACVVVAMFVVSTCSVGAVVVNAGTVPVVAAVVRAALVAAATYFASG
ncbi:MAG: hypothetical protein ABJA83_12090 [Burkholderiaceae bacterium]